MILLALAACGCGRGDKETPVTMTPATPIWSAYRGNDEVLRFKEGSGPLRSTAMLPVGVEPSTHPFLTATALQPQEEGALHDVLEASKSFSDFMERLKKAGYDIRPGRASP